LRDYLIDGRVSAGLPAMIRARADFHRLPESASLEEIEAHASVGRLTWEELVSKFGARSSPRRNEVWRIAVRQMPSLALLRNLRNALEAGVPKLAKKLSKLFSDEAIQSSKILPLRFFQAFDALRQSQPEDPRESQRVLAELIRILDRSAELNVPLFRGMTAVFVDVSGSMLGRISANSTLSVAEAAGCMASILTRRAEDAALFVFDMGTPAKLLELPKGEPAMKTAERIRANCSGGGTDLNLVFRALLERGLKPERVVILSDNQSHHGGAGQRRGVFQEEWRGPFCIALTCKIGGQSILPESWPRLNLLSGFSEKVFSLIQAFEKSQDSGSAGSSSIPRPVLEELRAKFRIPPGSPSQDQTPAAA
jgi:hypothetical protein